MFESCSVVEIGECVCDCLLVGEEVGQGEVFPAHKACELVSGMYIAWTSEEEMVDVLD